MGEETIKFTLFAIDSNGEVLDKTKFFMSEYEQIDECSDELREFMLSQLDEVQ